MTDPALVNRVANSGLITINLEDYFPREPLTTFDMKEHLFMGMILREKDFRQAMNTHDWTQYTGTNLAVFCSADAIVPVWAYQLVSIMAAPYAVRTVYGTPETLYTVAFYQAFDALPLEQFRDQRIVIKGCSKHPVPIAAYAEIARRLQPIAASIMYGEPCSTVPLYKKPKNTTQTT